MRPDLVMALIGLLFGALLALGFHFAGTHPAMGGVKEVQERKWYQGRGVGHYDFFKPITKENAWPI